MKSRLLLHFILLFLMAGNLFAGNFEKSKKITDYLPTKKQLTGWKPVGEPEKAVGEDLFLLINGGAEIYQEYGFKEAVLQEYANENGKSVNVEIYRMTSPTSAFGVYSFKTGKSGTDLPMGQDALLEEYYLNFWKGNLLVTLIGFDSEKETMDGLIDIARAIDSKINESGERPGLIDLLPQENLNKQSIKYLKGNLALFNNYEFDSSNIFGVSEGVIGDYKNARIFIFKYDSESKQKKWCSHAEEFLANSNSFFKFTKKKAGFSVVDRFEQTIYLKPHKNFIILVKGLNNINSNKMIKNIQARIETH